MTTWRNDVLALHHQGPFHIVDAENFDRFTVVIGHPEVLAIERDPSTFTNAPASVLANQPVLAERAKNEVLRTLIHMDAPDHNKYRKLTNDWFRPASLNAYEAHINALSEDALTTLEQANGHIDFHTEIALSFPLRVILRILGLPERDYPRMLRLTQELFGAQDPDLQRKGLDPAETDKIIQDFNHYFASLSNARRQCPTDDLASFIANGEIDGKPMPPLETMGYYIIVATAGHDTTAASMSAGLAELATHPDALDALKRHPELIPNAVEEMIRLASPVRHFMRTTRKDTVIGDHPFAAGDWLMLSFAGANVDPRVYDNPLAFDIHRDNRRQLAFGSGAHFCLGARLARMELISLFRQLIPRLKRLRLADGAASVKSTFVGGYKSLPIDFELVG